MSSVIGTPSQWIKSFTDPTILFRKEGYMPYSELTDDMRPIAEVQAEDAVKAAALAEQQAAEAKKAADAKAETDAAAKAIADAKAKSDKEMTDAATLLAARRRAGSSAYPSGAKGVLGAAPVQLKTLLGA